MAKSVTDRAMGSYHLKNQTASSALLPALMNYNEHGSVATLQFISHFLDDNSRLRFYVSGEGRKVSAEWKVSYSTHYD